MGRRRRILILILSFALLGAAAPLDEDYAVYAAAINGLLSSAGPAGGLARGFAGKPLLILNETDPDCVPVDGTPIQKRKYAACMAQLHPEPDTLKNFEANNQAARKLQAEFRLSVPVRLLSLEQARKVLSQKRNQGLPYTLSAVGLNGRRDEALCTINPGMIRIDVLLKKSQLGKWEVKSVAGGRFVMD